MWFRQFKDYPIDDDLVKEKVEPGKGIIGCEMHELNGWSEKQHRCKKKAKGLFSRILEYIFKTETSDEP